MDTNNNIRRLGSFYDDKNYPRGFSKHGDFSVNEAGALHEYGKAMAKLACGELSPETEDERRFVEAVNNLRTPSSYLELLWFKYQTRLRMKSVIVNPFSSTPTKPVAAVTTDEDMVA